MPDALAVLTYRVYNHTVKNGRVGLYAAALADHAALQPGISLDSRFVPKNGLLNNGALFNRTSIPDDCVVHYLCACFDTAVVANYDRIGELRGWVYFRVLANPHIFTRLIHRKFYPNLTG